jgi:homoserine dehydrogenase
MYYGAGAGGDATASAVIADIIDIVRGNHGPMLGYKKGLESGLKLLHKDEIVSQYYLRMMVKDRSGVLANITSTLGRYGISIESMLQKPTGDEDIAKLLFTTHKCSEIKMRDAMDALSELDDVHGDIAMMRIEK